LQFLLQEENAKPGEHVVRASATQSWWPDRSISAEVNLEPGKYEVLPKISATRNLDKPIVEDVVKKAAEENPQKLRQIGLNYDIAHAKGGFEEEQEMKKKKLAKEKKQKEEKLKKKKKEEEEKLRKEEEKLKKEEEEEKPKTDKAENGKTDEVAAEAKEVEIKPEEGDDKKLEGKTEEKAKPDAETSNTEVINEGGSKADADKNEIDTKEEKVEKKSEGETSSGEKKSEPEPEPKTDDEAKPSSEEQPDPEESEPESTAEVKGKEAPNPWNAIAVIGLRVYSKDPKLTVGLVKPKDPEEAALLDVDGGVSGAGATS